MRVSTEVDTACWGQSPPPQARLNHTDRTARVSAARPPQAVFPEQKRAPGENAESPSFLGPPDVPRSLASLGPPAPWGPDTPSGPLRV